MRCDGAAEQELREREQQLAKDRRHFEQEKKKFDVPPFECEMDVPLEKLVPKKHRARAAWYKRQLEAACTQLPSLPLSFHFFQSP